MEYTTLGNTGLNVSVAGLGCGGNSRLGLGRSASTEECIKLVEAAIDAGVNLIDTAESYGTEEIVGLAVKQYDRDQLVVSTKAQFDTASQPADVTAKLDAALKRLNMDYIDVFHLHAIQPSDYTFARDVLAPALVLAKEQGKIRHIGITEVPPKDPLQETIRQAVTEPPWEVVMLAYSMVNQTARNSIFPTSRECGVGTLLMFVVRNFFSRVENRNRVLADLVERGDLPEELFSGSDPLLSLVRDGGATSITDAAYRFARHQPGAHVVLFGTGNQEHLTANIESILSPPLDSDLDTKLHLLFGHLVGVGLDLPDHVGP